MTEIDTPTAVKNYGTDDETTVCCDAYMSIYQDSGEYFCKKCYRVVTEALDTNGEHVMYLSPS
jgi:hypothetical protein